MTKKYLVFSENSSMILKRFSTISEAENQIEKLKQQHATWNFEIFRLCENLNQGSFLK